MGLKCEVLIFQGKPPLWKLDVKMMRVSCIFWCNYCTNIYVMNLIKICKKTIRTNNLRMNNFSFIYEFRCACVAELSWLMRSRASLVHARRNSETKLICANGFCANFMQKTCKNYSNE